MCKVTIFECLFGFHMYLVCRNSSPMDLSVILSNILKDDACPQLGRPSNRQVVESFIANHLGGWMYPAHGA